MRDITALKNLQEADKSPKAGNSCGPNAKQAECQSLSRPCGDTSRQCFQNTFLQCRFLTTEITLSIMILFCNFPSSIQDQGTLLLFPPQGAHILLLEGSAWISVLRACEQDVAWSFTCPVISDWARCVQSKQPGQQIGNCPLPKKIRKGDREIRKTCRVGRERGFLELVPSSQDLFARIQQGDWLLP